VYDVETKMQPSQWLGRGPTRTKNTDDSDNNQGYNGCGFDLKGIVGHEH